MPLLATFEKLLYVLGGAYIWDSTISLKFDAQILCEKTERGSFAWAKWVYLACKYITMTYYSTAFVGLGTVTQRFNCEAWAKVTITFVYLSASFASSLIGIRAIVIWGRDLRLVIIVVVCLFTHFAFSVHNLTKISAEWVSENQFCYISNLDSATSNLTALVVCDTILLSGVLTGLLHRRIAHKHGIGHVLWRQGLVWACLAILAESTSVVLST